MFNANSAFGQTVRVLLLGAFITLAQGAFAQDFIKGGEETFVLNLGAILNQFDTTFRLDGEGIRGSDVNLESNGLEKDISSFQASATLRFLSRNRIDLLYFQAKRSGDHRLEETLVIDDHVFPVNFNLSTELKNQFLIADYRFSFVKTDPIEFAGLIGVYGADVKYNASATGVISGISQTVSTSASTTVPLPLIGVTLDWYINPRWKIWGSVAGFSAHISNVDGSIFVAGVATDFMLTRNFGLGLSYLYTNLNADVNRSDFSGSVDWKTNGVSAYAQLKF